MEKSSGQEMPLNDEIHLYSQIAALKLEALIRLQCIPVVV